jgi:diguanylate cyclase (GGDEF)-like protein
VDAWRKATLKSLMLPGGVLLLAAVVLLQTGILPLSASVLDLYYYSVFATGMLLAWRFHSSRVFFALASLLLAHRAVEFFSAGRPVPTGAGRIAFEVVAFLLPVNFIVLSLARERGLGVSAVASRLGLLFPEAVFVAIACRPGQTSSPALLRGALLNRHLFSWTRIPQLALLVFLVAGGVLLARFLIHRKPVEAGLFWALLSTFLALQAGGVGRVAGAYLATGGVILLSSIIELSYSLAYQDDLTALPSRRAFNNALLGLERPYAVAVVDIDHFKAFNDTYGHDTGDEVLRMVAARLARVTGDAKAFRVGGEEFSILFPGKSARGAAEHLERLRALIHASTFRVRGRADRRATVRGPDRRAATGRRSDRQVRLQDAGGTLSVTVSIGVAEASARLREAEQVIRAADKALYRAKQNGRNRVEIASVRLRTSRLKRSIA